MDQQVEDSSSSSHPIPVIVIDDLGDNAPIAQMVEHLPLKQGVIGSRPIGSTASYPVW